MTLEIGHYPQALLLVLARVAAIIWTVPFFGGTRVAPRIKTAVALMTALVLLPGLPEAWVSASLEIRTLPQMTVAVLREVFFGGVIGLIAHAFVGACVLGGALAAQSSSLLMAQTIDPLQGTQNNTMGQLLQTVFILFVVTCNGHLALIKLLSMSFESVHQLPMAGTGLLDLVLSLGMTLYDWGLRLALPVICAGLVVNVGMALAARMAPDFNILFLSLPIRVTVGLCVLGMAFAYETTALADLVEQMLGLCSRALT